jgi:DUF1365 family protein
VGETPHAFIYPATFFGFELSEIDQISKKVDLFGHNEFRPLSLRDKDYLYGADRPITDQLEQLLLPAKAIERTILISSPRYFGYAFNPVNFHLRMAGPWLTRVVAEVNNTFGDRHVYPLNHLSATAENTWTATCPKNFHVSPFNNMEGEYHFTFRITDKDIYLGIDLHRDGACVLKTWIQGEAKQLSNRNIWRYALLHPFDTALNSMPRILWQAAVLYYKKKLKLYHRPEPESAQTLIDRDNPDKKQTVI